MNQLQWHLSHGLKWLPAFFKPWKAPSCALHVKLQHKHSETPLSDRDLWISKSSFFSQNFVSLLAWLLGIALTVFKSDPEQKVFPAPQMIRPLPSFQFSSSATFSWSSSIIVPVMRDEKQYLEQNDYEQHVLHYILHSQNQVIIKMW